LRGTERGGRGAFRGGRRSGGGFEESDTRGAGDHALVRESLRTMLQAEDGLMVVAETNDGQQALSACRELRPDLVLMDVRMPVMDGLEATRKIKAEMPQTSVVMVTMHENPDYLFEAIKAGTAGYVLKDTSGERLLGAVRRTLGGVPFEPGARLEAPSEAGQGARGRRVPAEWSAGGRG